MISLITWYQQSVSPANLGFCCAALCPLRPNEPISWNVSGFSLLLSVISYWDSPNRSFCLLTVYLHVIVIQFTLFFFSSMPSLFNLVHGLGGNGLDFGILWWYSIYIPFAFAISFSLCQVMFRIAYHILFFKESSSLMHYLYFVQYVNFLYARKTFMAYYICQNVPFKTISGRMNEARVISYTKW